MELELKNILIRFLEDNQKEIDNARKELELEDDSLGIEFLNREIAERETMKFNAEYYLKND